MNEFENEETIERHLAEFRATGPSAEVRDVLLGAAHAKAEQINRDRRLDWVLRVLLFCGFHLPALWIDRRSERDSLSLVWI